mmetsp:Transcript_49151/g.137646  ORF Transcript_49151/g.137646 Transcript_49151/m.137646 type:complete len:205 (+) Transcript_49151:2148-2762(+)
MRPSASSSSCQLRAVLEGSPVCAGEARKEAISSCSSCASSSTEQALAVAMVTHRGGSWAADAHLSVASVSRTQADAGLTAASSRKRGPLPLPPRISSRNSRVSSDCLYNDAVLRCGCDVAAPFVLPHPPPMLSAHPRMPMRAATGATSRPQRCPEEAAHSMKESRALEPSPVAEAGRSTCSMKTKCGRWPPSRSRLRRARRLLP